MDEAAKGRLGRELSQSRIVAYLVLRQEIACRIVRTEKKKAKETETKVKFHKW